MGQFPSHVHRRHGKRAVALIIAVELRGRDAARRPNQRMQLTRARFAAAAAAPHCMGEVARRLPRALSQLMRHSLGRRQRTIRLRQQLEDPRQETVTITLGADEALILDALLDPVDDLGPLEIRDRAELVAVWRLSGAFEKVLVGTFRPDYADRLKAARVRLAEQHG